MSILKQKKLLLITVLLSALFLSVPFLADARGLVPCGGYNADGSREAPCTVLDAFVLVARVTNWLIAVAGVYAVYVIVDHSFWLVITMGNEEAITKHRTGITNAIVGMCLVFMAYMFVNTAVNYILLGGIGYQKGYEECKFKLDDPKTYLTIDPTKVAKCHKQ